MHWIAEPLIPRVGTDQVILSSSTESSVRDGNFTVERVCEDPFISMLTVQPSVLQNAIIIICEDFDTTDNSRLEYIPGDVHACTTFGY